MMHGLSKDNKIPKFFVQAKAEDLLDAHQEHIRNSEINGRISPQPVMENNNSQFQSCFQSFSALKGNSGEKGGHILDEIMSQKSEEVEDEEFKDANESDDDS